VGILLRDFERKIEALKKQLSGIDLENARIELIKQKYDDVIKNLEQSENERISRIETTIRRIEEMNKEIIEHEVAFQALMEKAVTAIVEKNEIIAKLSEENERLKILAEKSGKSENLQGSYQSGSSSAILTEFLTGIGKEE